MAVLNTIESLVSARDALKSSLEISRNLALDIDHTGARISDFSQRLPSLEAAIRNIACKCTLFAIRGPLECALGPAAALVNVFEVVRELGSLLTAHSCSSDLRGYLSVFKQLEEALRLLSHNCKLVILWLEDVAQFLEDNAVVIAAHDVDWYLSNVRKSLAILKQLQDTESRYRGNGGILCHALGKLENEFRHLLTENSVPLLPVLPPSSSPPALQLPIIQKLQTIMGCLARNNRLDKCMSIYVHVRISNVQETLQALDFGYLETSLSEFDSVQTVEGDVDKWGEHLEFVVKNALEVEYRLCNGIFGDSTSEDVWMDCFAKIALQAGIHGFIRFGNTITKGKKEALKLFKLLDVFATLSKLRLDFNRVFGGKTCIGIQSETRDLIKNVVNGACEIFWELSAQVERQRQTDPPSDGSVPRLVAFVIDYSNEFLDDYYRPIMTEILEIHWIWNHRRGKFDPGLLSAQVHNIVEALVLNLETWAKIYEEAALSYLFTMNARWYLCNNLKGTKVGDLMGDVWLKGHQEQLEYHATLYLRESWAKLPAILLSDQEGLVMFSGGRAVARDLEKKRIKRFNEEFDEMYRKQSNWVVCDKGLRWKTRQLLVEVMVPVYRSYMEKYSTLVLEEETGRGSPNKYVKYSAERLERMLNSMFEPKLSKYGGSGSAKYTHLIGKMKNVVASHFSSTPAAA